MRSCDATIEPCTPPPPAACFDDLPLPLQDALFQAVVSEAFPLHTWGPGGAAARRSLRGVCRSWAARLAALCTTAHVSSFWLPSVAEAVSHRPSRFPRLVALHVFVALLPRPHVRAAMRALRTPQPAWQRVDVHLVLVDGGESSRMLNDATLCAVAAACPRLRALRVQGCFPGGRPRCAVVAPLLRAASLQQLELSGCPRLTDAAVAHVSRSCPGLRTVALAGCAGLERPALSGAQLAEVDLSFCCSLVDDAVAALLSGSPALKHLSLVRAAATSARARALVPALTRCAGDAAVRARHRHAATRAAARLRLAAAP